MQDCRRSAEASSSARRSSGGRDIQLEREDEGTEGLGVRAPGQQWPTDIRGTTEMNRVIEGRTSGKRPPRWTERLEPGWNSKTR